MRQLVTEKLLAVGRLGVVLAWREVEVRAMGEGQGADRGRLVTDVDADVGEAGVEEGLHLLLEGLGQGLAAAAGLEREIPWQWEGIARVRLHGAGLCRGRQDRPGSLDTTGAQCGPRSAGRGETGQERSRRRKRAGLDRARHLRAYPGQGRGIPLDDIGPSAGKVALDDARRWADAFWM